MGEKEKQELGEAQEVTHDLEEQENKEVQQQSQSDTDQTRRWSKGNRIGSQILLARENPRRIQKGIQIMGRIHRL